MDGAEGDVLGLGRGGEVVPQPEEVEVRGDVDEDAFRGGVVRGGGVGEAEEGGEEL